jgi:hypothetical protein
MSSTLRQLDDFLRREDWGTVRAGEKQIPVRSAVTVAGAAVWLGLMLLETGSHGIDSLWTNMVLLGGLVVLGSLTRSVTTRNLLPVFLAGGAMLGIVWVVVELLEGFGFEVGTKARPFLVGFVEEPLKLAPVAFVLWRGRKWRSWSFGATDVLLMGTASAAAFGLTEDAFIRDRFGWGDQVSWLPSAMTVPGHGMEAGHLIWTALAAGAIGLALLWRYVNRNLAIGLAIAGIAWSAFDHIGNNEGAIRNNDLADSMRAVTSDGYVTIWLFVIVVIAAIVVDAYVLYRSGLPQPAELDPPKANAGIDGLRRAWEYRLDQRGLIYAEHQLRYAPEQKREEAIAAIDACVGSLLDRKSSYGLVLRGTAATEGEA